MPGKRVLRPRLDPRSHERQGHGGGDAFRSPILDGAVEVHRTDAEIAAAGGQHLADELVVGLVLGHRLPHPAMIGLRRVGPEIDGELRLDAQDVAPFHRPIIGKFVPLQQPIDQQPALVLCVRILDELARLFRGGKRADHIQIGAADEHRVGAKDRLDAQRRQLGEDDAVELARRLRRGRTFKNVGRRLRRRRSARDRQVRRPPKYQLGFSNRRSNVVLIADDLVTLGGIIARSRSGSNYGWAIGMLEMQSRGPATPSSILNHVAADSDREFAADFQKNTVYVSTSL